MRFAFLRFLLPLATVCVPSIVRDPFDPLRYTLQIMSSVAVVGTGYVGLTTAVCLADLGHEVIGVDIDKALSLVDIDTDDLMTEIGQTYGGGQPDITGANDGNRTHNLKSVTKGIERISHYARYAHRGQGQEKPQKCESHDAD